MQTVAAKVGVQGTANYLAPECLLHPKPSSTSTDVWSLGCTSIELMTGQEMWNFGDGDDNLDVLANITHALRGGIPPHASSALLPDEQYSQVLSQCLSFEPTKRPSAADVVRIDM